MTLVEPIDRSGARLPIGYEAALAPEKKRTAISAKGKPPPSAAKALGSLTRDF